MKTVVVSNVFSMGSKNMAIVNCKFNSTGQGQKIYFVVLTLCKQLKITISFLIQIADMKQTFARRMQKMWPSEMHRVSS
jgi:hypothetical protein